MWTRNAWVCTRNSPPLTQGPPNGRGTRREASRPDTLQRLLEGSGWLKPRPESGLDCLICAEFTPDGMQGPPNGRGTRREASRLDKLQKLLEGSGRLKPGPESGLDCLICAEFTQDSHLVGCRGLQTAEELEERRVGRTHSRRFWKAREMHDTPKVCPTQRRGVHTKLRGVSNTTQRCAQEGHLVRRRGLQTAEELEERRVGRTLMCVQEAHRCAQEALMCVHDANRCAQEANRCAQEGDLVRRRGLQTAEELEERRVDEGTTSQDFKDFRLKNGSSQGPNPALTVLYVPSSHKTVTWWDAGVSRRQRNSKRGDILLCVYTKLIVVHKKLRGVSNTT